MRLFSQKERARLLHQLIGFVLEMLRELTINVGGATNLLNFCR
jgi:hypothetical protein